MMKTPDSDYDKRSITVVIRDTYNVDIKLSG